MLETLLLLGAGVILMLFALFDAFITILSLRGGGPATTFITRQTWRVMLALHRRRAAHRLLSISGPVLLIVIVVLWYALLYIGWFLIFSSTKESVVDNTTLTDATELQTLYFIGTTLSGLGYGDFTAQAFPWTLYSTVAVATGTLLTSLALSYIIAVVPVALEKRQIANQINAVTDDWQALQAALADPANARFLWQQLFAIQLGGTSFSNKYGAYPVVAYFHATQSSASFSLAYLKATDILFYLANHPESGLRPPELAARSLKCTVRNHTGNLHHVIGADDYDADSHSKRFAAPVQIENRDAGNGFAWEEYRPLRRRLVTACLYDGW